MYNYFSGTQLGTTFPAFFLLPIFSYPSQQGSEVFFAAAFLGFALLAAAFLGAAFFVVAIQLFRNTVQKISQKGKGVDFWLDGFFYSVVSQSEALNCVLFTLASRSVFKFVQILFGKIFQSAHENLALMKMTLYPLAACNGNTDGKVSFYGMMFFGAFLSVGVLNNRNVNTQKFLQIFMLHNH